MARQETKAKLVPRKEVQDTNSMKETPVQTSSAAVPEGLKAHPTVAIIETALKDLSHELDIVVSSSANLINSRSCFGGRARLIVQSDT